MISLMPSCLVLKRAPSSAVRLDLCAALSWTRDSDIEHSHWSMPCEHEEHTRLPHLGIPAESLQKQCHSACIIQGWWRLNRRKWEIKPSQRGCQSVNLMGKCDFRSLPVEHWREIHGRFSSSTEQTNCEVSAAAAHDENFTEILNYMVFSGHLRTHITRYNFVKNQTDHGTDDQRLLRSLATSAASIVLVEFYQKGKIAIMKYRDGTDQRFVIENLSRIVEALSRAGIRFCSHMNS